MKSEIHKSVKHNEHIFVSRSGVAIINGAESVKNVQLHILLMPIFVQHFYYSNILISHHHFFRVFFALNGKSEIKRCFSRFVVIMMKYYYELKICTFSSLYHYFCIGYGNSPVNPNSVFKNSTGAISKSNI